MDNFLHGRDKTVEYGSMPVPYILVVSFDTCFLLTVWLAAEYAENSWGDKHHHFIVIFTPYEFANILWCIKFVCVCEFDEIDKALSV